MVKAKSRTALGFAAVALVALNANVASAYTQDSYIGRYASEQNTYHRSNGTGWITCVAASALTTKNYIDTTDVSAATVKSWFDEGYGYNKQVYTGGRDFGLDPRAWAYLLYAHTPVGYWYNDYPARLTPTWTQGNSNSHLVLDIRTTGDPAGALVDHGNHAFDVIGYQTTADPLNSPFSINGFYVIDPWYNGVSWSANGATYDLAPNTYIAISAWNANYFLTYTVQDASPATWHNEFVVILRRSTSGFPSDVPPPPYSDTYGGGGMAGYEAPAAPDYPAASLETAVIEGMTRNGLLNSAKLGVRIAHPTLGKAVFVESVVSEFPSYYLVEVREAGATKALAMVSAQPDGLHFAALVGTGPRFHLPDASAASASFASRNFHAKDVSLVWGWSSETMSPFAPAWRGTAADGTELFLGPRGEATSHLHLTRGSVPVGP